MHRRIQIVWASVCAFGLNAALPAVAAPAATSAPVQAPTPSLAPKDAPARSLDLVIADLAKGGSVILMRHANAPQGQAASVGMTAGCDFGDGRGLDAKGLFQARFIGEFFKTEGVPLGLAYTSDACRAYDTARLVAAGGPVEVEPALKSTDLETVNQFKAMVTTAFAGGAKTNILLVTHSNVLPLYADWGSAEEIPSGVILVVDPANWTVTEKLNLDFDLSIDGQ